MDCTTFLCEEIVIEILARLPAKSLFRFMAVCRLWKSIITSPQFSLVSKRPAKVLFHTNNQESYTLIEEENLLIFETKSPLRPLNDGQLVFLGSDNGLLCFGTRDPVRVFFVGVTIWNPSIRKHVKISPFFQQPISFDVCYAFGFGGTISGSDYKYVMFLRYTAGDCLKNAADIYSLKTGTWRRKHLDDDLCRLGGYSLTCALLEGRLHWIGRDEARCNTLYSFELEDEVFVGNIILPEEVSIRYTDDIITIVTVLKESLALFAFDQEERQTTVWVMEEHGDVNSWIKFCVIDLTIDDFHGFPRISVHLLKNGDLLLGLFGLTKNKVVTCNPKTRKTSDFGVGERSLSEMCAFTVHKESLVLLGDQYHCEVREDHKVVLPGDQYHCEVREDHKVVLPMFEQSLVQAQPPQDHPYDFSLHQYDTVWQMNNPSFIQVGYFPAWTGAGYFWYPLFRDQFGYYYAWTGSHYCNINPSLLIQQ